MGKRELLLIAIFAVVGVAVYQLTAPAGASGRGFSLTRIIEAIRSEFHGQNVELQTTRTRTVEPGDIKSVRVGGMRGTFMVAAEDRNDITVELKATVFGADQAQAQMFEKHVVLEVEPEDTTLVVKPSWKTVEMRRGPRVQLVIKVPSHVAVEVVEGRGELEASRVAGVSFDRSSGRAVLTDIRGVVSGTFRQGSLEINKAEGVELETERVELRITGVAGETKLQATQSGDVRLRDLGGPVTLDLERVEAEVEDVEGPLKVEAQGGVCKVRNPRGAVVMKGERLTIELFMSEAVPVDASTEADRIEVSLPPAGVNIEATAEDAAIRTYDSALAVVEEGENRRVTASLRGGGPLVKLHVNRGEIIIR